jgi:DNA polymerase-3 subunit delta
MLLSLDRLRERLSARPLDTLYFFYGNEPLQLREANDAVREAALKEGISERLRLEVGSANDWDAVISETQSLSLFSSRRLLELQISGRGLDRGGSAALEQLALGGACEDVLVVNAGALDRKVLKTAWYRSVDQAGVCLSAREFGAAELPRWLQARASALGKRISTAGAALMAERVEGNLLAAAQEIEKLALVVDTSDISDDDVIRAVSDSARYTVFQWTDALLSGHGARALRVLRGLREEGTEPPILTWALGRELRTLLAVAHSATNEGSYEKALNEHRVWQSRKSMFLRCLEAHTAHELSAMLAYNNFIDTIVKGGRHGTPWTELEVLTLSLSGQKSMSSLMQPL